MRAMMSLIFFPRQVASMSMSKEGAEIVSCQRDQKDQMVPPSQEILSRPVTLATHHVFVPVDLEHAFGEVEEDVVHLKGRHSLSPFSRISWIVRSR